MEGRQREMEERWKERGGGKDGCQREKIIAPKKDAAIRVTLSLSLSCVTVEQLRRHMWTVVNKLAGDAAVRPETMTTEPNLTDKKTERGAECLLSVQPRTQPLHTNPNNGDPNLSPP